MALYRYLWDVLFGGRPFDILTLLSMLLAFAVVIFFALPIHEYAHAYAAVKMGDNTPRWDGRLTLNPFAHLDVIGTLMILFIGFGYAKPVRVNPRNFKDYKKGMALTSFAGPASNLIMAFLFLALYRLILLLVPGLIFNFRFVDTFISYFVFINLGLAVFNLLPFPPLDGYGILSTFLPAKWVYTVDRYKLIIQFAVIFLLFSGSLSTVLSAVVSTIFQVFKFILRF